MSAKSLLDGLTAYTDPEELAAAGFTSPVHLTTTVATTTVGTTISVVSVLPPTVQTLG
jgi:hypothetical protein